eukprot:scaffold19521_cov63-Skeletonema_menzelii.AAC.1
MPGGRKRCSVDSTAEEVVVAAAVEWNFQAHEADHLHQIVHHCWCLLTLPSEQQNHHVPQKEKDCFPNFEQFEDESVDQRSAVIFYPHRRYHHPLTSLNFEGNAAVHLSS